MRLESGQKVAKQHEWNRLLTVCQGAIRHAIDSRRLAIYWPFVKSVLKISR